MTVNAHTIQQRIIAEGRHMVPDAAVIEHVLEHAGIDTLKAEAQRWFQDFRQETLKRSADRAHFEALLSQIHPDVVAQASKAAKEKIAAGSLVLRCAPPPEGYVSPLDAPSAEPMAAPPTPPSDATPDAPAKPKPAKRGGKKPASVETKSDA